MSVFKTYKGTTAEKKVNKFSNMISDKNKKYITNDIGENNNLTIMEINGEIVSFIFWTDDLLCKAMYYHGIKTFGGIDISHPDGIYIKFIFTKPKYRKNGYALKLLNNFKNRKNIFAVTNCKESDELFKKAKFTNMGKLLGDEIFLWKGN